MLQKWGRNTLACLVAATLVFGMLPALTAYAQSTGTTIDLSDSTTPSGTNWTLSGGVFTVTGDVTITGTTTDKRVVVASGTTAHITLDYAQIDVGQVPGNGWCAFDITGATVDLSLVGTNILKSGDGQAGLLVPDGASLTIASASGGSLDATGIGGGAGIGGGVSQACGRITINSGTINAESQSEGAGIGSGRFGTGGNITINGGTVSASALYRGAGIGGGRSSTGGNITINGGTVTAQSLVGGSGIGGGYNGAGGNTTINGGAVNATGNMGGAGIGGGGGWMGRAGVITIGGGTVIASGGVASGPYVATGAGIGGGTNGNSGVITITKDAQVTATGGAGNVASGAGIGGGGADSADAGLAETIIINTSGAVTAVGGVAANGCTGANIGAGGWTGVGMEVTPGTSINYRTVAIAQGANGTIAPLPDPGATSIPFGANQTYLISPNPNYKIASVTVDGTNVGAVTTWTIPGTFDNDHTIAATFVLEHGVSLSETGTHQFTEAAHGYSAQTPFSVTVTNIGTAPTGALSVALSGANAASFTLSAASLASIASGGTHSFTVVPNTGLSAGSYAATITVSGAHSVSASFGVSFTVGLGTQQPLSINGLGTSHMYGTAAFGLSTAGGSGSGTVTYLSSDSSVASVSGSTVTIHKAGTFTITATKAADANYQAASVVSETVTVSLATPTVGLTHNNAGAGSAFVLTATVGGVGVGSVPQGTVTFYDGATALGTVTLNASGVATYTIDPLDGLHHSYMAAYSGQTDKYHSETSVSEGYEAGKLNQAGFMLTNPGTLSYGDSGFSLATAGGNGTGAVTYSVPSGNGVLEVTSGGSVTIVGAGTVVITAEKAEDATYNETEASLSLTVGPRDIAHATISVLGAPHWYADSQLLPAFEVTDGAVSINSGDYMNSYGTNLDVGIGAGSITLTGQENYFGTKTVTFDIEKRPLTGAVIALEETSFVYTGAAITPRVASVEVADINVPASDYDVSYSANIAIGTATVTVTAKPGSTGFTGSASVSFSITDQQYLLTVSAGSGGTVYGTPSGSYGEGELVSLTADPESGYLFSGWTAEGIDVPDTETITFDMPANTVSLTAVFARQAARIAVLRHFATFSGTGDCVAEVDAHQGKFTNLLYNNSAVSTVHYYTAPGDNNSTVITLRESYLKTLPNGLQKHVAEFSDGTSDDIDLLVSVDSVTVIDPAPVPAARPESVLPQTGDDSSMLLGQLALAAAAVGLISLVVWNRRQRRRRRKA
jgi:LPXTG-motif cell wall-anchored protein